MRRERGQRVQIIEREIAVARGVQAIGRGAARNPVRAPWPRDRRASAQPASAPEPIGQASAVGRSRGEALRSRKNASACASRKCENRIGCACCMCVMPGMGTPRYAFGLTRPARQSARATAARVSRAASFTNMRKSVATSSLRLRAGVQLVAERAEPFDQRQFRRNGARLRRAMLPAMPDRSPRARRFYRARPACRCISSTRQNARRFERARPHAVHGQLVGQQAAVERQRALKLVEQLVGRAVKPPAPQLVPQRLVRSLAVLRWRSLRTSRSLAES